MRVIIASSVDSPAGIELTTIDPDTPDPYAILSHTWVADDEEVTYTDIFDGKARSRITYESKIAPTCRRATADGYKYVWVDTCCIDKSSSAEFSEAINSMFQWYRKSAVCYVLLSDVPDDTEIDGADSAFARARWFTRGFTLQELLAPPNVVFYSRDWVELGNKASLGSTLAAITKVDVEFLIGHRPIETASVANRMGWAANRVTKRPEDIAYCLMGIFSVNMPLLYGEGSKAFIRLQEEIMKSSTDHSLFAWIDEDAPEDELRGVLAQSPSMFSKTSSVRPFTRWERQEPYSMTNTGLSIHLPVSEVTKSKGVFMACFDCPPPDVSKETFFGIILKKLDTANDDMRFARIRAATYCPITVYQYNDKRHVYLSIHPPPRGGTLPVSLFQQPIVRFDNHPSWSSHKLMSLAVYPGSHIYAPVHIHRWPLPAIYLRHGRNRVSCAILIGDDEKGDIFLILIGSGAAAYLAYHVVDKRKDRRETRQPINSIPNIDELEHNYYDPKPMGEVFRFRNTQVQLWLSKQEGQTHMICVDVKRVKAPANPESSISRLRNELSRLNLHR